MILPKPGPAYEARNEAETRAELVREDGNNQKKSQDIVISGRKFILISPDGTRWYPAISNLGLVTWTAI